MATVLVAEDEPAIVEAVVQRLRSVGSGARPVWLPASTEARHVVLTRPTGCGVVCRPSQLAGGPR